MMSNTTTDAPRGMIPKPRYVVGDRVWHAGVRHTSERVSCPDCGGARVWHVITPLGATFDVKCPRCTRPLGPLPSRSSWVPDVKSLTIGSVRIDTNDLPVQYMCIETGVGSGTIYRETSLFPTYLEATANATERAREQSEDSPTDGDAETRKAANDLSAKSVVDLRIEEERSARIKAEVLLGDLCKLLSETTAVPVDEDDVVDVLHKLIDRESAS